MTNLIKIKDFLTNNLIDDYSKLCPKRFELFPKSPKFGFTLKGVQALVKIFNENFNSLQEFELDTQEVEINKGSIKLTFTVDTDLEFYDVFAYINGLEVEIDEEIELINDAIANALNNEIVEVQEPFSDFNQPYAHPLNFIQL